MLGTCFLIHSPLSRARTDVERINNLLCLLFLIEFFSDQLKPVLKPVSPSFVLSLIVTVSLNVLF